MVRYQEQIHGTEESGRAHDRLERVASQIPEVDETESAETEERRCETSSADR